MECTPCGGRNLVSFIACSLPRAQHMPPQCMEALIAYLLNEYRNENDLRYVKDIENTKCLPLYILSKSGLLRFQNS